MQKMVWYDDSDGSFKHPPFFCRPAPWRTVTGPPLILRLRVVIMAARLTDRQKQKIIADYVELGSYNAVAKINSVSDHTVKKIVQNDPETAKLYEQKKEENREDILAHMETRQKKVCEIIDLYLEELLKVGQFKSLSPSQLTTALGTLIDKWTAVGGSSAGEEEDGLSRSLRELGQELESDDKP